MTKYTNPLDHVKVAAPCPADWERMVGDERVRFCNQCNLHVYNLSGMTRSEAETLVTNAEGRLCVRFYRRVDGTILTRNCPVGLRALKQRVSRRLSAALSAVLSFFAGFGLVQSLKPARETHTMGVMVARPSMVPTLPVIQSNVKPSTPPPVADAPTFRMGKMLPIAGQMAIEDRGQRHWNGKQRAKR